MSRSSIALQMSPQDCNSFTARSIAACISLAISAVLTLILNITGSSPSNPTKDRNIFSTLTVNEGNSRKFCSRPGGRQRLHASTICTQPHHEHDTSSVRPTKQSELLLVPILLLERDLSQSNRNPLLLASSTVLLLAEFENFASNLVHNFLVFLAYTPTCQSRSRLGRCGSTTFALFCRSSIFTICSLSVSLGILVGTV